MTIAGYTGYTAVYKQSQRWNGLQSKGFSLNGIVH